jgi:hypothetical protein
MLTGAALLAVACAGGALGDGWIPGEARRVDLSIPAPAAMRVALELDFPAPPRVGRLEGPRGWSGLDWGLEGMFALSLVADYLQTLHTARPAFVEENPILGAHPSPLATTAYFVAAGAAHAAVARLLPAPWRELWQVGAIAMQAVTVGGNLRAGVGFTF